MAYQEEKGRHSSKLVVKCNSFPETRGIGMEKSLVAGKFWGWEESPNHSFS